MYPACHLVPEANGEQRRIEDVEAGSTPCRHSTPEICFAGAARQLIRSDYPRLAEGDGPAPEP